MCLHVAAAQVVNLLVAGVGVIASGIQSYRGGTGKDVSDFSKSLSSFSKEAFALGKTISGLPNQTLPGDPYNVRPIHSKYQTRKPQQLLPY